VFAFAKLRYTETGFTVNGVDYEGGLLCVGNMLMSWAPKKFPEVTPDRSGVNFVSFSPFFWSDKFSFGCFVCLFIRVLDGWNDVFASLIILT
jgi:hypothetical protein